MKPVFQGFYTPSQSPAPATARAAVEGAASDRGGLAISNRIEQAFDAASTSTGTSFDYLVQTAKRESAFNPDAKARTSTAAGLFQFTESTWMETLKNAGSSLGLGVYSDAIQKNSKGRYDVADPELRKTILGLRYDPEISSMMAGALTRRNAEILNANIGRAPTGGELYIAHFLGARGASSLISLASSAPDASAADYFPRQAEANKSIFYKGGSARSVSEVYAELVRQHGDFDKPAVTETMATAFADPDTGSGVPSVDPAENRVQTGWHAVAPDNAFASLFRNDSGSLPLSAGGSMSAYAVAPALFDVALAEDQQQREAAEIANPAGASLATRRLFPTNGPLDLSQFLKPTT